MMRRTVLRAAAPRVFRRVPLFAAPATSTSRVPQLTTTQMRFATDAQTVRAPHRFENFCDPESRDYVEELYKSWQKDRNSVDPSWTPIFENLASASPDEALVTVFRRPQPASSDVSDRDRVDNMKLAWMIRAYETRGHHTATLDPLGMFEADLDFSTPAELEPQFFGFSEDDMNRTFNVQLGARFGGLVTEGTSAMTLRDIIQKLRQYYCGNIAFEFMSTGFVEKRNWWRQKIISTVDSKPTNAERLYTLDNLIKAERFEKFLHTKFATHKRFGLDGAESLVGAMNAMIEQASNLGVEHVVVGMPHRGRLNILTNVCGKSFSRVFNEFNGKTAGEDTDAFHSGDVKYHLGISRDLELSNGKLLNIQLLANPSHLEAVNPLVLGKACAKQLYLKDTEMKKVMPVILHGDAAFSGQGICYESMGLSELENFDVGGTIHIVVNNQVGFTTDPFQSRSAMYCTDLAKVNNAPVMHVNGDDVDAVARVARIAAEYRQMYNSDVVIDLVCYRRFGHNETDEPMFTQPLMYKKIRSHPSILVRYGEQLVREGVLTKDELEARIKAFDALLKREFDEAANLPAAPIYVPGESADESPAEAYVNSLELQSLRRTAVDKAVLKEIGRKLTTLPDGFTPHTTVAGRVIQPRAQAIESGEGIEWGLAESLAFGALLMEGVHVRITGQDVQRGTFTQRHAVIHDVVTGKSHCPLSKIAKNQAPVTISNSSLSEFGVCGFELGYSLENPKALVIWEAQFGDFSNGAQVIFDQFMASGEAKWNRQSSLAVSLPHGYDGMGPEHSSARIERFLQLSDDQMDVFPRDFNIAEWAHISEKRIKESNWQVCYPSTPANYFHMLRRQVHREFRKPLVFFFSKKYLRAPNVSTLDEMAEGSSFRCVIPHPVPITKPRTVAFCTGQIYHILREHQLTSDAFADVALIRVEQLAPFPVEPVVVQLQAHLAANPETKVIWVQEEPKNMGAWSFVRQRIDNCLKHVGRTGAAARVEYVGRPAAASPATGYGFMHNEETEAIKKGVFA